MHTIICMWKLSKYTYKIGKGEGQPPRLAPWVPGQNVAHLYVVYVCGSEEVRDVFWFDFVAVDEGEEGFQGDHVHVPDFRFSFGVLKKATLLKHPFENGRPVKGGGGMNPAVRGHFWESDFH